MASSSLSLPSAAGATTATAGATTTAATTAATARGIDLLKSLSNGSVLDVAKKHPVVTTALAAITFDQKIYQPQFESFKGIQQEIVKLKDKYDKDLANLNKDLAVLEEKVMEPLPQDPYWIRLLTIGTFQSDKVFKATKVHEETRATQKAKESEKRKLTAAYKADIEKKINEAEQLSAAVNTARFAYPNLILSNPAFKEIREEFLPVRVEKLLHQLKNIYSEVADSKEEVEMMFANAKSRFENRLSDSMRNCIDPIITSTVHLIDQLLSDGRIRSAFTSERINAEVIEIINTRTVAFAEHVKDGIEGTFEGLQAAATHIEKAEEVFGSIIVQGAVSIQRSCAAAVTYQNEAEGDGVRLAVRTTVTTTTEIAQAFVKAGEFERQTEAEAVMAIAAGFAKIGERAKSSLRNLDLSSDPFAPRLKRMASGSSSPTASSRSPSPTASEATNSSPKAQCQTPTSDIPSFGPLPTSSIAQNSIERLGGI